jgi:hypothetical protein
MDAYQYILYDFFLFMYIYYQGHHLLSNIAEFGYIV